MPGEYDPYLTKSTARGMRILSIAMVAGGVYLLPLSLYAWRTNTKVHLGGGGHSLLWPWEGFATAFLMLLIGVFAWRSAGRKAKEWKERNKN
jgi:chromate transport protein ChrA